MPSDSATHPHNPPASELRKHYFLDQYSIIAPKRNLRPDAFAQQAEPHKAPSDQCHFCNNHEPAVWQTPRGANWHVKVIANAFPALSLTNPNAFGVQEIVINTPTHDQEFSELPLSHIAEVFASYGQRLEQLKRLEHIRYVLVFKNDGPVAGASVAHAHCQILALPLVPPRIKHESDALNHYWDEHNSCAYCDIIKWESTQKTRVIATDKHFIAISPYAAMSAFEVWLIPKRHVPQFGGFSQAELHSLAVFLKNVTSKLDSQSISFNYFLQESLASQDHHFVLKVEPRTTKYAGAELGTGVTINPVLPEYAALWYLDKV
jgi:UDPglucose--hexose-1-phosphate uridylyltransferase